MSAENLLTELENKLDIPGLPDVPTPNNAAAPPDFSVLEESDSGGAASAVKVGSVLSNMRGKFDQHLSKSVKPASVAGSYIGGGDNWSLLHGIAIRELVTLSSVQMGSSEITNMKKVFDVPEENNLLRRLSSVLPDIEKVGRTGAGSDIMGLSPGGWGDEEDW